MNRTTVYAVGAAVAFALIAISAGAVDLIDQGLMLAVVGAVALGADRIEELKAQRLDIAERMQGVQDRADTAGRDLNAEEIKAIEQLHEEFERLDEELARREKSAAIANKANQGVGRVTDPGEPGTGRPVARGSDGLQHTTMRTREERERNGFNNVGEFGKAVRNALVTGRVDERLISNAAASTYSSEGVGADGGYMVPPSFATAVTSLVTAEDSLLSRCDAVPTESNMVIAPTDEDTVWGSSGGVRVYRRAEAAAMTQSKLALKETTTRIEELYALVPVTDGLLQDAPMLANFLTKKAGEKINFKITDEIINGTGSQGQMLGILNAPCLVTVSKEGSQAADTIVSANILKMYSRMPDAVRRNAVWLINQDIEPQLLSINLTFNNAAGSAGIAAGVSGLVPEGGLRYDPTNGTLMGRPIISTEAAQAIGDKGDIILAYLPGYFAPYKAGGVRSAMSMHLWFDQGLSAFRWTFRIGGQPWLSAAIARKNGSNTLSHFVTLEAR